MNRSMDDLLRDTLRSRAADSTAGCVDVETAAAFVDGTLSARARASAEAHIADCSRCQAVLAALVRSTPPSPPRTWWRRPSLAWLVPAAVAAGAVAIWVNVPDRTTPQPVQMQSELPPPIESVPTTADSRQSSVDSRQSTVDSRQSSVDSQQSSVDSQPSVASRGQSTAAPAAASPPQPAGASLNDARSIVPEKLEMLRARQTAAAAAAKASSPPAAALAEAATSITPVRATIISSDRTIQWRIGAAGEVQRSADAGGSWQTQVTGDSLAPLAGSSPSGSVCWLVGRAGLVLITTDGGQSWRRLPFPVAVDLASVRAADDQTATIVSVDGRTLTTSDAGRSWK